MSERTRPAAHAGVAGWLAGGVALLVLLVGTAVTGANGFLELVANGATAFVPLPVFDAILGALGPLAKGLLFAAVALTVPLAGALLGYGLGRIGWLAPGGVATILFVGSIALLLAELVVLPVFGQGAFGTSYGGDLASLQVALVLAASAYGFVLVGLVREGWSPAGGAGASAAPSWPGVARPRNASEDGPDATGRRRSGTPGVAAAAATTADQAAGAAATADLAADAAAATADVAAGARAQDGAPAVAPTGNAAASTGRPDAGPSLSRRSLLGRSLIALGGVSLVASGVIVVGRVAAAASKPLGSAGGRPLVDDFGVTPRVTPLEDFYVIGKDLLPTEVDIASWRLAVTGLVDGPVEWTLDDLAGLPRVEGYRTLQCISNEVVRYGSLIGNQWWAGVRMRDVLDAVGVRPEAGWVLWKSADGYTESLPLEVARDERTWLVTEMGSPGAALPREHGFPLRVLIAGRYGMKQPKYLTGIELAAEDEPGYWEQRGWDETAAVRTYSRIDSPVTGDDVSADASFRVYGIASAGERGIARVEVSADDGATWTDAELEAVEAGPGDVAWTRWRASVTVAAPGRAVLVARAVDGEGGVQDAEVRPPLPSGASGLHRVTVSAIR